MDGCHHRSNVTCHSVPELSQIHGRPVASAAACPVAPQSKSLDLGSIRRGYGSLRCRRLPVGLELVQAYC